MIFISFSNVLSSYFYVSLNLVAVFAVWILIKFVTQLLLCCRLQGKNYSRKSKWRSYPRQVRANSFKINSKTLYSTACIVRVFFLWGILERQISKSRSILVTRRFDCLPWSSQIKLFHLFFAGLKVVGSRKCNTKPDIGDSCMGISDKIEVATIGIKENAPTILTQESYIKRRSHCHSDQVLQR